MPINEHPMLFSGPMVRAILAGRKTQTRRVIRWSEKARECGGDYLLDNPHGSGRNWWPYNCCDGNEFPVGCPYGRPGDRLWVRETWQCHSVGREPEVIPFNPRPSICCLGYKATEHDRARQAQDEEWQGPWIPSIHMPRWASRITLEVTDVRVQRVQDIAPSDARSEGIESAGTIEVQNGHTAALVDDPISKFKALWDSINAKRGYGWDENPWVWVVEFKRLETI